MDWRRHLTAAHGYLDLGMGQEAWDELEEMPPQDSARREVVLMRLLILQSMERWDKAAEIAIGAVRYYPDCPDIYLMGAYAIRRHLDVSAALEFLQTGRAGMAEVPNYWTGLTTAANQRKKMWARACRRQLGQF